MAVSLFDLDSLSDLHLVWTLPVLLLSALALLWTRSLGHYKASKNKSVCPPELLKDNLGNGGSSVAGITNAYVADREMTVPFDIGEVRVSTLLVHPIKVRRDHRGSACAARGSHTVMWYS